MPMLLSKATELAGIWRYAGIGTLRSFMKISDTKADEVKNLYANWSTAADAQTPAIDAFVGDIYSGLQVQAWSDNDRAYAHRSSAHSLGALRCVTSV